MCNLLGILATDRAGCHNINAFLCNLSQILIIIIIINNFKTERRIAALKAAGKVHTTAPRSQKVLLSLSNRNPMLTSAQLKAKWADGYNIRFAESCPWVDFTAELQLKSPIYQIFTKGINFYGAETSW